MNAWILAALLVAASARAEEGPSAGSGQEAAPGRDGPGESFRASAKSLWSDASKWLGGLKTALAESAVRRHQRQHRRAAAVAAVRGNEQLLEDPSKPYWKGSSASRKERAERQERAELTKAVELALDGKADEALKALDAFESARPKSALLDDCRQAREKIKAALKDSPGPSRSGAAAGKSEPVRTDEEKR